MKVTVGANTVLGAGKYSISGSTRATHDTSEFGDDVDTFEFGTADGGTLTISDCLYDPGDTTGQVLLESAMNNVSKWTSGGIRFYINTTSYRTVATGGYILITKAYAMEAERNGMGRASYEFKVSGRHMVLV